MLIVASVFGHGERGRVFDRDFTIAALAFLCSRLLAASKRGRAAAVIQRAYRRAAMRKTIRQRCLLAKLAHDCKAVVVTRRRVIGAAGVLQRAWRAYVEQSKGRCTRPVRRLQVKGNDSKRKSQTAEGDIDIWLA